MRLERLTVAGDPHAIAGQLRDLVPAPESVRAAVGEIIARVRSEGDAAVHDLTQSFDTAGLLSKPLRAEQPELDRAAEALDPAVREGLERAIENVRRVCEASLCADVTVSFQQHEVTVRGAAVERAGIYVPGGRAPYPSTVMMGVVPARVAGVAEVAVCAPPGRDGELDRVVLGACKLAGASLVYRMGGAQAIAALAYGTESVTAVDVIAGPGNLYVQEAKRQVFGQVGIDGFAGPSDLVVIADSQAEPGPLALDLLAQAEHGPGTVVVAVSTSKQLLEALGSRLEAAEDTGAIACTVLVADHESALRLAQAFAPEHLQLVGPEAERLAPSTTRAGCVFIGAAAGTAFGDYIAGSNHVLPTGGAARFASSLTPEQFRRRYTEVRLSDGAAAELAPAAAPLARAEGFELHARSMEARIRNNG
jgi:histidinol dehydrogenase